MTTTLTQRHRHWEVIESPVDQTLDYLNTLLNQITIRIILVKTLKNP